MSQVLSHLGSGAEIDLAALTAAQTGAPGPDGDFNRKVWDRWDAMPPAEHAAGFLEANQRLVEAYESLDPTTRAELRIDLGFLPEPVDVATAARFRLSEFALHQWDVEVGFNPHAAVTPVAVRLLLDQVGGHARLDRQARRARRAAGHAGGAAERARPVVRAAAGRPDRADRRAGATRTASWSPRRRRGCDWPSGGSRRAYTPDSVRVTGPVSLDDLRRVVPGF